jgi:hypothetical protein
VKILIHLHLENKEPMHFPTLSRIWDQVDEFEDGNLPKDNLKTKSQSTKKRPEIDISRLN